MLMVDIVSAAFARAAPRQLPAATAKDGVAAPSLAPVNVERIKSLPKLVTLASALAEQGPPVDFAKIAQVRQAIALGTYRVNPEAIAEGMMRFAGKVAA
jgi:negative regulator of flagellin synthesis FlgM